MDPLTKWLFRFGGEIILHNGKVSGYREKDSIRFANVDYAEDGTVEDLDKRIKESAEEVKPT